VITIFDNNNIAYVIRPCPLINITWSSNFNEDGQLGGKYDITLTGTLLDSEGSPIFNYTTRMSPNTDTSFATQYYPTPNDPNSKPIHPDPPEPSSVSDLYSLNSILAKQIALRELFSKQCVRIEVASVVPGETEPIFHFYPKFISINFAEGVWVNRCDYTITLEAQFILDKNDKVIGSESYATQTFKPGDPGWPINTNLTIDQLLDKVGGFIEDFQESWALEPEEGNGNTFDPYTTESITKVYRLTRNITAKGKNIESYKCFGDALDKNYYKAYEQARRYVTNHIKNSGLTLNDHDDYPGTNLNTYFASGLINLSAYVHGGYNHSRTENIDITQGTYSVQDTWILSSGSAYENYSLSLSSSEGEPRNKVSIDGTIKGLTSIPASGSVFGGNSNTGLNTAYENAINKYRTITNHGQFGLSAHVYKRAQNAAGGITLNHIPLSLSLATNEFTGEINYTIEYDDRPPRFVDGAVAENISVSDTYPGDVFAVIPVIGRPTGPVLQYIGGRTEYQRSLTIEILVNIGSNVDPPSVQNRPDYTEFKNRQFLLKKPSLVSPTREGIVQIINAYSPAREPGIRKYFVSPPQETWDPREGRYTLNLNWTYELNY
jgi:hypothetical protein